jgi:hypothetical protein
MISIKCLIFSNCHRQKQQQVATLFLHVVIPLKNVQVYLINQATDILYQPSLPSFVLLVLLVAVAKILEVKAGTSIGQPICPVCQPALSAHLQWIFCQLICLEQSTLLRYLFSYSLLKIRIIQMSVPVSSIGLRYALQLLFSKKSQNC